MRTDNKRMTQAAARPRIVILGAGGHGRVVLDILHQARRFEVAGFLDSNPEIHGRRVDGVPVLGPPGQLAQISKEHNVTSAIIAVGDNGARRGLARAVENADLDLGSAIHPAATLARSVLIGRNVVIAAGAVVCANCQVGDSAILNTGCIIDHQTMVGEGAHVCPGVRVGARVKIEPGVFIGIGATIIPNVTLGCEAIIGAGAVVIEDVEPMSTVVGVPARSIKLAGADEDVVAMLLPTRR